MRAALFSGGIDSTALVFWTKPDLAITVDYGQTVAPGELRASETIAAAVGIPHRIVHADLSALGAGSLAGKPTTASAVSPEWWPYRNQMLITLAAMATVGQGLAEILIGTVKGDDRHSDGTPEFLHALDLLLCVQEPRVRLSAPAIHLSSEELIRKSGVPPEVLGWSFSCHVSPEGCGQCRGCEKHRQVFASVGLL